MSVQFPLAAPAVQQVAVALWRAPIKGGATSDEDTRARPRATLWHSSRRHVAARARPARCSGVIAQLGNLAKDALGVAVLPRAAARRAPSALNAPHRCLRTPRVRFLLARRRSSSFCSCPRRGARSSLAPRGRAADDDERARRGRRRACAPSSSRSCRACSRSRSVLERKRPDQLSGRRAARAAVRGREAEGADASARAPRSCATVTDLGYVGTLDRRAC